MNKEMKISILGFGTKGIARTLAYKSVLRYYPSCPTKPVLYQAFTLPADTDKAKASGWQVVTDLDAVIQDPETEYVDVCLPCSMRFDAIMKSLEAGKHVFCEAPFEVSSDEARQMVAATEARPKLLNSVNFVYRRCPANIYARKLIRENKFGKLLEAHSHINLFKSNWFALSNKIYALNALFDTLYFTTDMNPIQIVAFSSPRIKQHKGNTDLEGLYVNKTGKHPLRKFETDDATRVMYTLPDGAIGSLECKLNSDGEISFGYEFSFENGAIKWSCNDVDYLNIYDAAKPEQGWSRVLASCAGFGYPSFADDHMNGEQDFLVNACYENMLKISGEPEIAPIATLQDACETARIIRAIRASYESRTWIELSDFQ